MPLDLNQLDYLNRIYLINKNKYETALHNQEPWKYIFLRRDKMNIAWTNLIAVIRVSFDTNYFLNKLHEIL
jgi:hypothetical protein